MKIITGLIIWILFGIVQTATAESGSHQLLGPGACRGPKWSDGDWPIHVGDKSIDDCSQLCQKNKGCTSFSLSKGKGPLKPCLLYHHTDIQPAAALGGECFKITAHCVIQHDNTGDIHDDTTTTSEEDSISKTTSEEILEENNQPLVNEGIITEEEEEDISLDWSKLGHPTTESPRVKKAKKKLKKILDAKYSVLDQNKNNYSKETGLEIKKAKIHANKRDVNARRIARVTQNSSSDATENNDTLVNSIQLKINNPELKKNIRIKGSQDQQESTKKKEKVTTKTKDQVDETIKAKGQEQQPSEKDEKKSKKSDVNKPPQKETETKDAKKSPPEKTNAKKKEDEEQPSPKKPKSDKKPTTASNDETSKKSTKEEPKSSKTGETKNTEPVKTAATPKPEKPKEDVKPSKAKKATELPPTKKDDKPSVDDKKPSKTADTPVKKSEATSGKPKDKAPVPAKAEKAKDPPPALYDGKMLVKIGEGGCRGQDWNRKGCPKLIGRVTLDACAKECRKSNYCTAFHVLKFDSQDGTHECLIFGHVNIIAVKSLGGECYTLVDTFKVEDEEEEEENQIETPVRMIEIGKGQCRGKSWTFGRWPIDKGQVSAQECADACARKKGCTAFDLSNKSGKKFSCFLYGHQDVEPASGLKGICYTYQGNTHTEDLANEEVLDELEDQEDESDQTPGKFKLIGKGQCRGPNWQFGKWPVDKGTKTRQKCANVCKKRPGCVAFDLSPPDSTADKEDVKKGELQCNLFGHDEIIPATGLKGNCYRLLGAVVIPPEVDNLVKEQVKKVIIDDGSLDKLTSKDEDFDLVGNGLCRGKEWQIEGLWPKDEGVETFDRCNLECKKDQACTAFDVSPSEQKGLYRCHHFGHDKVTATNSVSLRGKCYRMKGRKAIRNAKPKQTFEKDAKNYKLLGQGMCRGADWQQSPWPIVVKGLKTVDECFETCTGRQGCTAFEMGPPSQKNKHTCLLMGHDDVQLADSLSLQDRTCYRIPGRLAIIIDAKKAKVPKATIKASIPPHITTEEVTDLGSGLCRGPKWQRNGWPYDEGIETFEECFNECKKIESCTAFDLSPTEVRDKFRCYLFGHDDVIPATSYSFLVSNCYRMTGRKAIAGASPPKKVSKKKTKKAKTASSQDRKHTMIGHGLCRGPNWQTEGGHWPKDEGFETLENCSKECEKRPGCTGFDLTPSPDLKGGKERCILFGHQDIELASAFSFQESRCFRMIGRSAIAQIDTQPTKANIKATKGEGYTLLGRGLCRGSDWQDPQGIWPKFEGLETVEDCFQECKKDKGCTAFDVSPSDVKSKFRCVLHGHGDINVATSFSLRVSLCYKMQNRSPLDEIDALAPEAFEGQAFYPIGPGLCRGEGWQFDEWPQDGGLQTLEGCADKCENSLGCQAFDTSEYDKKTKTFKCWLHGHKEVEPASGISGTCYKMSHGSEEAPGLLKVGDGVCRGPGWNAKSAWPKVKGKKSLMECGEQCANTLGCTSFDIRLPTGEGQNKKYECTLHGHADIEPASGVSGTCFRVTASFNLAKQQAKKAKKSVKQEEPAKKAKKYVVPEFEEPKVLQEDDSAYFEEEPLFQPPPAEVRSRAHIDKILNVESKTSDENLDQTTLKKLKTIYEQSIVPLEKTYKYKELSHRHFGDPEIFSKPLIVLMGPWSGGKSTMINYILGNEYNTKAFKSGAEPSEGFNFNIAMHGEIEEELEGTELAAEFSFSSLQKFGQEFLKKLRAKKMPNKLLQKAIFAEIPGLLETGSKKIDRRYPFNDACQWFIDHADLILLVYDYTKLDIGPEAEALLDQLKGRESQVRIILNKADEITVNELLKIQNNLVWNVSPHMASLQPPRLYAGSFWSHPYKVGAPKELLQNQEASLLRDIRDAINKRIQNRISTARRFAVRVRNHAKMVDVYLATFNSKKGLLGNAKSVAEDIIQNPQNYHIYDGISTMTNISRYDLPDPESYRIFFGLHPLTEFPTLQNTCTYFDGCPINKMDTAISYDLPELMTDYKRKKHGTGNANKMSTAKSKK